MHITFAGLARVTGKRSNYHHGWDVIDAWGLKDPGTAAEGESSLRLRPTQKSESKVKVTNFLCVEFQLPNLATPCSRSIQPRLF